LGLPLRAGAVPGGELRLIGAECSDRRGNTLETSIAPFVVPLSDVHTVALTAPRPNPFRGETSFGVTLASPGEVVVGIYDLAGRRVATAFRGRLEAGTTSLVWRGTTDDGARAPSGVYFSRVDAAGQSMKQKLFLLAGP